MMFVRAIWCTVVMGVVALGAGCDGPLDVDLDDAVGTFVLRCVAGKGLPDELEGDARRDCGDRKDRFDRRDRFDRKFRDDRTPRPRLIEVTAEFEVFIVHETVRLRPDGTGTITSVVDLLLVETGEFVERRTITRDAVFALDDGRIEVAERCPEDVDCVVPRSLILRRQPSWFRDELYQAFSPFGGPALLYERVSSAFEA